MDWKIPTSVDNSNRTIFYFFKALHFLQGFFVQKGGVGRNILKNRYHALFFSVPLFEKNHILSASPSKNRGSMTLCQLSK